MENQEIISAREQQVAKANELIEKARLNLSINQQKLIAYLISLIKPTDKDLSWYYISVSDFCELIGIEKKTFYDNFKNVFEDLDKKSFWIENDEGAYKFRWISEFYYLKGKAKVKILLNSKLKIYLIGLKEHYTQYELWNILALKSKYSIRLYELFKRYGYRKVKYTKEINLNELKEQLLCVNYSYRDFKRDILDKSVEELNKYTDIQIIYNVVKTGRKVTSINFLIMPKEGDSKREAYYNTADEINRKNKQIKGQININDYTFQRRLNAEQVQEDSKNED